MTAAPCCWWRACCRRRPRIHRRQLLERSRDARKSNRSSPVQALIDRARAGDRVTVTAGTYEGDLVIDRALALVGIGRPRCADPATAASSVSAPPA